MLLKIIHFYRNLQNSFEVISLFLFFRNMQNRVKNLKMGLKSLKNNLV
jgi:hypothetical protein